MNIRPLPNQSGSTLVIALVFLLIITVVAVYSLESSTIQSRMVNNSLFTTLTYHECRNEQEAQLLRFNIDEGAAIGPLLTIAGIPEDALEADSYQDLLSALNTTQSTIIDDKYAPQSTITVAWSYIKDAPAGRDGYDIDTESQFKSYIYETTCNAVFNTTSNNQTLGAVVSGLKQSGVMN
ncbi:hypothetical protein NBRC116188_26710 [Oceaniserpentilla sp. 4NH20-0058]|uniref:pilus assembly PilX family protein n=1 Tax=Oceaniserpentilla sp. 4NH20-0058 TaxID=3127660 RepID=UPI0031033A01